jgi:hypothetical protein
MHLPVPRSVIFSPIICLFVLFAMLPAIAQEATQTPTQAPQPPLDPNAVPDYGTAAGAVGFSPDPFRVQGVEAGGSVDAIQRNLGENCAGRINIQPDFRFAALGNFDILRFIFIADVVNADGSLIVRDPQGNFYCNNDSFGVPHPTVTITDATLGDYNVWVGGLTDRVFGDLYVTTQQEVVPSSTGLIVPRPTATPPITPTPTPIPADALNYLLPPTFGTDSLAAGFLPDPYWRVVIGGGVLPVETALDNVDETCGGYTSTEPVFAVDWSGISARLSFLFAALDDERDPALAVRDPAGNWLCNRDFAGGFTRPQVAFVNPVPGIYNVWVSDEAAANRQLMGVVYVTEKTYSPETVTVVGTPNTPPVNGLTPSVSAFVFDSAAPDPYAIPGSLGGGSLNIGEQNPACPGTYTELPSFGFTLPDPTLHLRTFFVPEETGADATLILRMPDGRWYCNDDSFNGKQPTIDVIGNFSTGEVSIWVGSYESDETVPGTLYLTRGSANPRNPLRPPPADVRG